MRFKRKARHGSIPADSTPPDPPVDHYATDIARLQTEAKRLRKALRKTIIMLKGGVWRRHIVDYLERVVDEIDREFECPHVHFAVWDNVLTCEGCGKTGYDLGLYIKDYLRRGKEEQE